MARHIFGDRAQKPEEKKVMPPDAKPMDIEEFLLRSGNGIEWTDDDLIGITKLMTETAQSAESNDEIMRVAQK